MLLYSPSWLYLYPGAALLLLGLVGMLALATGPVDVFGRTWQIHTMLGFVALTLIGAQVIQLGVFARTYARVRIGEHDPLLERLGRGLKLEHGLLVGGVLVLARVRRAVRGRGRVGARRVRDARARLRDGAPRHGARAGDPDRLRVVLPRAPHDAAASRRAERRGGLIRDGCRRARVRPSQRARAQRPREAARARGRREARPRRRLLERVSRAAAGRARLHRRRPRARPRRRRGCARGVRGGARRRRRDDGASVRAGLVRRRPLRRPDRASARSRGVPRARAPAPARRAGGSS